MLPSLAFSAVLVGGRGSATYWFAVLAMTAARAIPAPAVARGASRRRKRAILGICGRRALVAWCREAKGGERKEVPVGVRPPAPTKAEGWRWTCRRKASSLWLVGREPRRD